MNPIRGLVALPWDCRDIEWFEVPVAVPSKPKRSFADFQKSLQAAEVLPEPIKFKSLADTINDLVSRVRGHKRPSHPLAVALSGK